MAPLSQAPLLDGLCRVARVPFRASYFTVQSILHRYGPTAHWLPVQPVDLLPLRAVRSLSYCASWRTSSDYYAPSVTLQGPWNFVQGLPFPTVHLPSHPLKSFPCSACRTQTERCRWRVLCLPRPLSAASQRRHRVGQVYLCHLGSVRVVHCIGPYSHDANMISGLLADISDKVCQGVHSP